MGSFPPPQMAGRELLPTTPVLSLGRVLTNTACSVLTPSSNIVVPLLDWSSLCPAGLPLKMGFVELGGGRVGGILGSYSLSSQFMTPKSLVKSPSVFIRNGTN